jgi:hypothetical protein
MDAAIDINLMYADTLQAMDISLTNLAPSDTSFHGVAPGKGKHFFGEDCIRCCLWYSREFPKREDRV